VQVIVCHFYTQQSTDYNEEGSFFKFSFKTIEGSIEKVNKVFSAEKVVNISLPF